MIELTIGMPENYFPLHPAQQDVYMDQLLNRGSPQYNIGGYIVLKGDLDKTKFQEAVSSVPEVFDAFKMRFDLGAQDLLCHYDSGYTRAELKEQDFSEEGDPSGSARAWMQARFNTAFLLTRDELPFEQYLLKITDQEHWFFGKYHHLITDGYGFIVYVQYVGRKYSALVAGGETSFSYPAYREAAESANEYYRSASYGEDGAYWRSRIGAKGEKLLAKKYGEKGGKSGATYVLEISGEERSRLASVQELSKSGLQQLTLAALLIYFGKISASAEFIFGVPIHKRGSRQLRNTVGMFSGILPFKGEYRGEQTVGELLKEISNTQRSDYRHQNYLIGDLGRELKINPSEGYLCEVFVNYEPLDFELGFGAAIAASINRLANEDERNPLQLCWREYSKQTLELQIQYLYTYFTGQEIELLAQRVIYIIEQFPQALDKRIGSINILPGEEETLLAEFNNTQAAYPKDKSIVKLFEEQAQKTPEGTAIIFEKEELSYKELNGRSNQMARYLQKQGVKAETLVPICVERGIEMVVGILGILKAGGAYVPIDPEYPQERISYMLEDTGAAQVLSTKAARERLRGTPAARVIAIDEDWENIKKEKDSNPEINIAPEQLAYVIYTSGSTGQPKGVMIEHGSVVNLINTQTAVFGVDSNERILQFSNYCFDASVEQMFLALFNGSALIMFSEGLQLDTRLFDEFLSKQKVSHLHAIPTFLENIQLNYRQLKRVIAGGDVCSKKLAEKWNEDINFYNEYGPTETTVTAIEYNVQGNDNDTIIPIGKPLANVPLYILNAGGSFAPIGVAGEMYIGGVQVARGYLNREELTAERFIKDPFSSEAGARLYRTGDLGRWLPDGNVEYLGRIDNQVKIRGYRIELGEIENTMNQSELIRQGVVLTKEDSSGNKRLVGYVVPQGTFDRQAIQSYLNTKLPEYMVPAIWVELESLPLTSTGKIDRKALPDPELVDTAVEYAAPRNETETKLTEIWQKLLGIEQIGIYDNFFALGGHSLLAMRVVSSIRKELNEELSIRELFVHPTIAGLGAYLDKQNKRTLLPAITAGDRPEYIPLSFSQERLWFIDRLEGSVQYHLPAVLRLKGSLDQEALDKTLRTIINRHEVLRTAILEHEGQGYQYIMPAGNWSLGTKEDLVADETSLTSYIGELITKPFDLSTDYMLRADLIRLGEEDHILAVTMHHIASDGWSTSILVKEVVALYEGYLSKRPVDFPSLEIQYADYAIWQRSYIQSEVLDEKLAYWKEKLAGVSPLELPIDYNRPAVQSSRGAAVSFEIGAAIGRKVQALSHKRGVTHYMTLLSVFKVLLYRYSGQEDICVGTPVAGRNQQEIEGLIGFFINTLALRSQIQGDMSFSTLLEEVKVTTLEAYSHQEVPFERVVDAVVKDRDMSRTPLFQVEFVLQNTPEVPELKLGELTLSDQGFEQSTSKFDLTFFIKETKDGFQCLIQYNTDLYKQERILRMASHFTRLLESAVSSPEVHVGRLKMLSANEQKQLLVYGSSCSPYPVDATVPDLFEVQALRYPDREAVVFGGESISYKELNEHANLLAHELQRRGVKKDTLVPLYTERGIDMLTGILGILKAGGAYVPIDTDFPGERLSFMLEDTDAAITVSSGEYSMYLRTLLGRNLEVVDLDEVKMSSIEDGRSNPPRSLGTYNLAYVIYTSGSTGKPKGVKVSHGNLVDYVYGLEDRTGISACRSYALVSTIATDLGNTVLYSSLIFGGTLHVFTRETVSNIEKLHEYFSEHRIDCLKIVPSHWKALTMDGQPLLPAKLLIFGGEALQPSVVEVIRAVGTGCRIINHYGPTETTIGKLLHEVDAGTRYDQTIPIGKPFSNTRVYILSKEGMLCPIGVPGQLYVAGDGVSRGYLNQEELTSEKFIADPYGKEGSRMYGTGDMVAYKSDGNILFIGRVDDQVKIRGYRVEPGEVSRILSQSELVSEGVVMAKTDSSGNKRLVGYVVPQGKFDKQAIQNYLSTKLPEYMVPAIWVELERLPLTPNGKIDRKALPDPEITAIAAEYVAPRNETEQALAGIWQELLGVERIGIYDNFFELGGDSILTIQVVSRTRRLGYVMQPKDIFKYQEIAGLSAAIGRGREKETTGEQGLLSGAFGLLPIQSKYLGKEQLAVSHYTQSVLLGIDKSVGAAVLQTALEQLVRQHDALRLVFERNGENWQQRYGTTSGQLHQEDLRVVAPERLAEKISGCSDSYQRSLSIERGELLSMVLMQTPDGEEKNRLLIVIHHLAVDGVSWRILLEDLEHLLDELQSGHEASLEAKSSSYRQWQSALVDYGLSHKLQGQKSYWEQVASSYKPLPEDKAYEENVLQKDMRDYQVRLSAEQTKYLLQEVPRVYHTEINDLLLASLSAALCNWSGKDRVVIGLEGHGREAISPGVDSSRTVGWFTSLYPVLLPCSENADTLIKEVKETLRRVPDKGLGYGVLKYINKEEKLGGRDPWDLVFNYLGQLDTAVGSGNWLTAAGESRGSEIGEAQISSSRLSVNSAVSAGELVLRWSYSSGHFEKETIHKLAGDYIAQLEWLISYCLEQEEPVYTPSDYGLGAEISWQELDGFMEAPCRGKRIKDEVESICRLSGLQQGMLFHGLYDGELGGGYIEQLGCDLSGVNPEVLIASWSEVIKRHSILRSAFYYDVFGVPVQCVYQEVTLPVAELDYRGMDKAAQAVALQAHEATDRARGFDFKAAPLMRLSLIRLDEERYRMLWTSHHLLFDGWSRPVLIEEFLNTYEALLSGLDVAEAAVDRYEDYIRYLEDRDNEAEERYWRGYLGGIGHGTLLPFIRTTAERTKGRGAYGSVQVRLDEATTAHIRGYAQAHHLTLNSLLQGVWALLLHKYTGEREVLYGVVVSGRPDELTGVESRVGMYINTLALKAEFSENQKTVSWLQGLQAEQVSSRQYQYSALQEVQGWTGIKGDLFDSILVFENYPVSKLIGSKRWSLQVADVKASEQTNYPLTIIIENTEELIVRFNYNTELLEGAYVSAIRDQFAQVLRQITDGQTENISDIRVLTAAQEEQLLVAFNNTETDYAKESSIVDLFEEQAQKTPEAIAIVFEDKQLTYEELNRRSNQVAHYLQKQGVKAETLVPICVERSLEMVVGILGVLKAGGAYVPIDPNYPQERISYMLEDTGAELVLSTKAAREKLGEKVNIIELDGDWDMIGEEASVNVDIKTPSDQLAYVIYTSGSTGRPKGVMIEHGSLVNYLINSKTGYINEGEGKAGSFIHLSYTFDASLTGMFMPLLAGKYLVIGSNDAAEVFTDGQLEKYAPYDFIKLTPSHLDLLPASFKSSGGGWLTGKLVIGGEALRLNQLGPLIKAGVEVEIINEYGPTEATVGSSVYSFSTLGEQAFAQNEVPIGGPVSNTKIYILSNDQTLSPVGVVGEIMIGGAGLARGYLNRPELTAEKFIKDPFSSDPNARLYRTGDLGRWLPEGNIEYMGRKDDQVKIRGYRIELGEIESILNQSELIRQGVVLAKEDTTGNKRLVGYVVPQGTFDKQAIQNYLSTKLPEYMVPGQWVALESVPLTPNGKIDRKALPDPEIKDITHEYVAPRNETEAKLAGIWQELLGVEQIGIYDNFFELGGDSILTIQVVSRMRRQGYMMQPRDIFKYQEIAGLSAAISRGTEKEATAEQGLLSGTFGLLPIQSWYLGKEQHGVSHYNQSILLSIDKSVTAATLHVALEELMAHHDALRLGFERDGESWQQRYGTASGQLKQEDLREIALENLSEAITARSDSYQRSLSIDQGQLLRMVLIGTPEGEEKNRLLIVIHHLAVDGVSWRILVEDLEHLLEGLMSRESVSLGAKSSSYRQWRSALEGYAGRPKLGGQKDYWQQVVGSYEALPEDKAYGGEVLLKDMQDYLVRLSAEQTKYLLQEVPRVYHTEINDLLLASLSATLCNWSGKDRVVIGLEGHGREAIAAEIDSSRTVGWFTSLYPVLLESNPDAGAMIKEVKEALRRVPDKGLGYGVLKYINKTEELQGRDPWDLVFNYLGQLDTAVGSGGWLSGAGESMGAAASEAQASSSRLSVNSAVSGGELVLRWSYSSRHYEKETIYKLAGDYIAQLEWLISHCLEQEEPVYTPSDYGLGAEVAWQELDGFLEAPCRDRRIKDELESIYRLSSLQQGMLFHGLYDGSGSYIEQLNCDLTGVHPEVLLASWQEVIKRHSILRSAFYYDLFNVPVQCVYREVKLPVEDLDYRSMDAEAQAAALQEYEAADRAMGFDFRSAPLMRLSLIRLDEERYRMLWTSHHLLFDGWSQPVLMEEFLNTYEALLSGHAVAEAVEDRYEDYIRYLEHRDKEAEEGYWREYLRGISHGTLLPFIHTTAERTKGRGAYGSVQVRLDEAMTAHIQGYAQSHRLTVNSLIQGIWALLLHKYTGEREVLYGVVVSGRPDELAGVEGRVGMYINTLAFKAVVDEHQETAGWLQGLQADQVSSRQYQYAGLQDIQHWTGIKGDLFDSLLVFENYPVSKLIGSKNWSLGVGNVKVTEQTNYPLTIIIGGTEELTISFSYNAALLEEAYVKGIRDQFTQVLGQVTKGQAEKIGDIGVLTAAQERQLLAEFNNTQAAYPKDKSIVKLFEEQAQKTPEGTAIIFEDKRLTYKELNKRSNQMARYLQKQGVKAETLVPICVERGIEMVVGILGILKAGGAYVPIDPEYPQERISYMLEDTGAAQVLSTKAARERLRGTPAARVIAIDEDWENIKKEKDNNLKIDIAPEQLAYVIYTSGSTGQPKGVMIEHGSAGAFIAWCGHEFSRDEFAIVYATTSICFDLSVYELFYPLSTGKPIRVLENGLAISSYLAEDTSVLINTVPSVVEHLQNEKTDLGGVSVLNMAGEPIADRILEGLDTSRTAVRNLYGPTEDTTYSTVSQLENGSPITIGKPIWNTRIYILSNDKTLSPVGVAGEIMIGGAGLARGYLNRPELTAKKFIKDPFSSDPDARLYRTGDLGRWLPDGNIEYLGRKDDQVKVRGYRIELGEIENTMNQSGQIRQGVVQAKADSSGNKRLVGYVVPQGTFDRQAIQSYLSTKLPEYMVPATWVELDSLPLTPNGKIDRKALPDPEIKDISQEYIAPRNATEQALAGIWQELLGIERIGIYDNFFELGGRFDPHDPGSEPYAAFGLRDAAKGHIQIPGDSGPVGGDQPRYGHRSQRGARSTKRNVRNAADPVMVFGKGTSRGFTL